MLDCRLNRTEFSLRALHTVYRLPDGMVSIESGLSVRGGFSNETEKRIEWHRFYPTPLFVLVGVPLKMQMIY
ncbi:hypothetical protein M404DRAFT_994610 [Pisolithus tinctorius Marx 270]|uniref:Uncharacterized protein n=1 Tax=Pisolithus tinctorius Marx 270 TaxID=870435 RepID=A0A0C3PS37_PISTI|nr:hypothetical protein M404DRAFT_994610 [Pisolithus tinctorius Marx 270]